MNEQPMAEMPALYGAFKISADIRQVALNGPPLRLRVVLDIDIEAGKPPRIVSKNVTPTGLEEILRLAESSELADPETMWPIAPLTLLHQPDKLKDWLKRPLKLGNCEVKPDLDARYSFTTGSLNETKVHQYRSVSGRPDSMRSEINGFAETTHDGQVEKLDIEIRRWARLNGESCKLVQEERLSLTSRNNDQ